MQGFSLAQRDGPGAAVLQQFAVFIVGMADGPVRKEGGVLFMAAASASTAVTAP